MRQIETSDVPRNRLEEIGDKYFYHSRLEEVTLSRMLKMVSDKLFEDCKNLKNVYMEDSYRIDFSDVQVPDSAHVGQQ